MSHFRLGTRMGEHEMLRRRDVIAALMWGAPALSACSGGYQFRYRLTVNVSHYGRPVAGSNVRSLRWRGRLQWAESLDSSRFYTQGDATTVDLGEARLLVATLSKRVPVPELQTSEVSSEPWTPIPALMRALGDSWRSRRELVVLNRDELPILVAFRDRLNKSSVVEVTPDTLATEFAGTRLDSVSVEVVNAPVNHGEILTALPWLKDVGSGALSGRGRRPSADPENSLSRESFTL
jgi:hypothetical protein